MRKLLTFIITFLFLFAPFIRIGGLTLPIPYILVLGLLIYLFVRIFILKNKVNRNLVVLIYSNFVVLFYLLFISITKSYLDKEMLMLMLLGMTSLVSAYTISIIYIRTWGSENTAKKLVEHVFYACSLHALIMVVSFFVPFVSEVLYSFVILSEVGQRFVEMGVRSPGLTGSGGDHLSLIQGIGLVFGLQICIHERLTWKRQFIYLFLMLLLVMSILLSARSGLVIVSVSFLFLVWINFDFKSIFFKLKLKYRVISFTVLLLAVFLVSLIVLYFLLKDSSYVRLFNRSFEFINQYYETGVFSTKSTDVMRDMYFIPDNLLDVFFGTADFGRNEATKGYLNSDIGFVRMTYGFGILGVLLIFVPLYYSTIKSSMLARDKNISVLLLVTLFVITIFNFKVLHVYGNRQSFKVLFLILFTSALLNSSRRKNEE